MAAGEHSQAGFEYCGGLLLAEVLGASGGVRKGGLLEGGKPVLMVQPVSNSYQYFRTSAFCC
jgi:hypothetical protein